MRLKYFLLVIFISVVIFNPLFANKIHNIHIELPASNISIAREQAFDQARLIAIKQYAQLNPTEADRINELQNDPLTRSKVIQSVKVIKEKFERQRYTCFLDVIFNPEQLSRFLKPKILSNSKVINSKGANPLNKEEDALCGYKKILILPIYISEDASLLWEDENLWCTSWQNQEATQKKNAMVHYTVPLSDLSDQMMCSIEDAMTERSKNLALISKRYHQESVIITILRKLGDSENYELIVKFAQPNKPVKVYETYHIDNVKNLSNEARFRHAQRLTLQIVTSGSVPDSLAPDPELKSVVDHSIEEEEINSKAVGKKSKKASEDVQAKDKQHIVAGINGQLGTDLIKGSIEGNSHLKSPIEKLNNSKQKGSDLEKDNSVEGASSNTTLSYSAKFSDLKQWQMIRQIIRQTDGVSNFRVSNLSTDKASFNFDYEGDTTQLVNTLNNQSLRVTGKGERKSIELISTVSSSNEDVSINELLGY